MRRGLPAARLVEPDLLQRIEEALRRCLEYDPQRRFQSITELTAALNAEAVASSGQSPKVELPRYVATGGRGDLTLFLRAGFGLVIFLLLASSIFPESSVRIRLMREMAMDQARQEVVRRGCALATPSWMLVNTDDNPYNFLAERFGYEAGRGAL